MSYKLRKGVLLGMGVGLVTGAALLVLGLCTGVPARAQSDDGMDTPIPPGRGTRTRQRIEQVRPLEEQNASPLMPTKGLDGNGLGYCVTVNDVEGNFLGRTDVFAHRANPKNVAEYRASVKSAALLAGRLHNVRVTEVVFLDSVDATIELERRTSRARSKGGGGGTMYCACTSANFLHGSFMNCSGPCASCTYCVVTTGG